MPPLPADSIHARACKLKCEKILTRPSYKVHLFRQHAPNNDNPNYIIQVGNVFGFIISIEYVL